MNILQQLVGVPLPIVRAPMAGVQGSALAAAVCNGGGLGSLDRAMLGSDKRVFDRSFDRGQERSGKRGVVDLSGITG